MAKSKSYDATNQILLGGNLQIQCNNPDTVGPYGVEAFSIKGCNNENKRFTLAHHDNGVTRVETEQTLQVDVGVDGLNQGTGLQLTAHKGKIAINSEEDHIVMKASKTITLDAESIILKAGKAIQIGGPGQHDTREIKIIATKIEVNGKSGNLPDHLKQSSFLLATSGPNSFVGDMAMGMARSYGVAAATAAGGPVAGIVAKKFLK